MTGLYDFVQKKALEAVKALMLCALTWTKSKADGLLG